MDSHCASSCSAKGGGVTAGKSEESGHGDFSPVGHIDDLLGRLRGGTGSCRGRRFGAGQVMTKGEVSLALTGKGHGWSLGVDLSELKIER